MSVELKVLEKMRSLLIAETVVSGYVANRVYAEHISSVSKPKYPAISLHVMPGQATVEVPDAMANVNVQIDLWFPSHDRLAPKQSPNSA